MRVLFLRISLREWLVVIVLAYRSHVAHVASGYG